MKKKIVSLLVLAGVITGGVFVYEQLTFKRLSAQLQQQADEISIGYQTLATEHLLPLAERYDLPAAQERIIDRVEASVASLEDEGTLAEKVQNISMLQVALASFIKAVTPDQPFVKDESFVLLQKEMGERGDMRTQLSAYNTTALRWNNNMQSEIGSLTARVGGTPNNLLPYLRFDGEQEYVTIVEL